MKTTLLLFTALLLNACGPSSDPSAASTPPADPAIQSVFGTVSTETPALPIPTARAEKQPGETVVLEGRIMGVMEPFVENRAVFVLGDNSVITPCSDMATDHCATPWDACCDPTETRTDGTASIQIVNEQGQVLKQGLEGVNGLAKLTSVKVSGTVNAASSPKSLIVNATTIEVMP